MKKLVYSFLLLLTCILSSYSQKWEWSEHISSIGDVKIKCSAIDGDDNIYLGGRYDDSALEINGDTLHNVGERDGFICKFNSSGILQWMRRIGGAGKDIVTSIVIVGDRIFVGGNFNSTILHFSPTVSINNDNSFDAFFGEYDKNGNIINAIGIFSGVNQQRILDMTYDPDPMENCLLLVGYFKEEIKYYDGSSTIAVSAGSSKDLYLFKSNLSGEIIDTLIYRAGASSLKNINLSADGGYYIGGDLKGTLHFNAEDSIVGNTDYNTDAMLIKVHPDLSFHWVRKGGGMGYDHVNSARSDIHGNMYIAGKCESTITFDSTETIQSHPLNGYGIMDLYLAKYNPDGNLRWLKRKGDEGNDDAFGLALRENLVQFCGNIAGEVIFNVDTLKTGSTSDVNTGFAIYDTKGNEIGAQGIGGTGTDIGEIIAFTSDGRTVISGYFDSPELSIGDSTFTNTSGNNNGFIAMYYYPMKAVFTKINNISCNGLNDGELLVTPYFGIEPYEYEWSANVVSHTDSLAVDLEEGFYSVTVTDSRDSTATIDVQLFQPEAIDISPILTDVSCYNGSNGEIDITVTGGTVSGAYDYSWQTFNGSGVTVTAEDQAGLSAAKYYVTVTDDNDCLASDSFLVDQPLPVTFGNSIVTNASGGGSDGEIDLVAGGGTTPYNSYSWTGPGTFTSSNEDITGLDAGTYNITVEDANACVFDTAFFVDDISLFNAFISAKTNVSCNGGSDGSATVDVSGGTGPYSYSWSNGGNTATINNLEADSYYVTVTDESDSRTEEASVEIKEPAGPLTATLEGTDLSCHNDGSGVVDMTVGGGTLPYTYSWTGPDGFTSGSEDIVNIDAGTYNVTVTDANDCIATGTETVEQPGAIVVTINQTEIVFCNGDLSAILEAGASGGTGTYSYLWDDPADQSGFRATGLGGGNYTVTVTDGNDCEATESYEILEPAEIQLTADKEDMSCYDVEDGSIYVDVTGGTRPYQSYRWQLDGSNFSTSRDIDGLGQGIYTLTVTDANDCHAFLSDTIHEPDPVELSLIEVTGASCNGYDDGFITMTATGGTEPYTYSVDEGANYRSPGSFSGLTAGSYALSARDANSCLSADSTVTLTEPEGVNIVSVANSDISCNGRQDGSITISAEGGAGGLLYSIDDGITYLDNGGEFNNLAAGDYPIMIKDADGCETSGSTTSLNEPDPLEFEMVEKTNITCYGYGDGIISVTGTGGTVPYIFSSDGGETFLDNGGEFNDLPAGDYSLMIRDNNNCDTEINTVSIAEPGELLIDTVSVTHVTEASQGEVVLESTGGTQPLSFFGLPAENDVISSNNGQFEELVAGLYDFYAVDVNNCTSDSIDVQIISYVPEGTEIVIYDAFSPNNDGINDVWNIPNIDLYDNCVVMVFNSWGNEVFSSSGYDEPWDGTYNGKELPSGTYYYTIDLGDGSEMLSGTVNIVK